MLLQSARNITIGVLCEEKSKWAHTHTHTNIPLLLGRQPLAQCSLSVNRRVLCFLQQEPAAETCYSAVCRPEQNLTISQRLQEKGPCSSVCFVFFKDHSLKRLLSLAMLSQQLLDGSPLNRHSLSQEDESYS